jgi:RNA-binding protein
VTSDPNESLTPKQRALLRSLAHHLKPVHHVGKDGITDAAVHAVSEAFNSRELIKVKVQESSPMSTEAVGEALAAGVPGAHHVQTIGRTVVLFRAHPQKPEIRLPR